LQLRLEFFLERFASALSERRRRGIIVAAVHKMKKLHRSESQKLVRELNVISIKENIGVNLAEKIEVKIY
jgi:hypothetical protein